jgi:hypothetical protein
VRVADVSRLIEDMATAMKITASEAPCDQCGRRVPVFRIV